MRVSPVQGKILQAAWVQLGGLYLGFSRWCKTEDGRAGDDDESERWEEKASRAYEMAARFGSELGRAMAVKTNPYAKMCAGMVREVMKREFEGGEE